MTTGRKAEPERVQTSALLRHPDGDSADVEFETRRVSGGVWVRVVLAGVAASGIISTDDARTLASALKFTANLPVPPQPPKKGGAK